MPADKNTGQRRSARSRNRPDKSAQSASPATDEASSTYADTVASLVSQVEALKHAVESNRQQAQHDREAYGNLETLIREHFSRPRAENLPVAVTQSTSSTATTETTNSIPPINDVNTEIPAIPEQHPHKIIDLPPFCGRPEDWPMFIASYRQTTETYHYTPLENMARLQKCLSGEAKEDVGCLLIHPNHIEDAITSLEFRFGQPAVLVRSQLQKIHAIEPISDRNLNRLVSFASKVRNLVAFLDAPKTRQHLTNPTLIDELLTKLPVSKRLEWAEFSHDIEPYPTLKDFNQWISRVARFVSMVDFDTTHNTQTNTYSHQRTATSSRIEKKPNVFLHSTEHAECDYCKKTTHTIKDCPDFLKLSTDDRWDSVRSNRLCFFCLKFGHNTTICKQRQVCDIQNCKRYHHPLLHSTRSAPVNGNILPQTESRAIDQTSDPTQNQPNKRQRVLNCLQTYDPMVLFRVVAVKLYGPNRIIDTYALLDEGSSVTMIDAKLAKDLKLNGPSKPINLQWYGNRSTTETSRTVRLQISGMGCSASCYELENVRTINNLNLPTQTMSMSKLHSKYHSLKTIPITDMNNALPRLLIGLDNCHLGTSMSQIQCNDGPVAVETKLGWIVYGPYSDFQSEPQSKAISLQVYRKNLQLDEINQLVANYYTTENFGVTKPTKKLQSDANQRAINILQTTTKRIGDQFETGLLWAHDNIQLPDSRPMAIKRLTSIERKMIRDPIYAEAYSKNINDYIQKGYAKKMNKNDIDKHDSRVWYLPHFGVRNPNKPDKLRLVFDAAATVNGISLNSKLLTGPDLNQPLVDVLYQFRFGQFGVTGDIKEMFHQIKIRSEDQSSQRFLWRNGNPSQPLDTYVMVAMTFGASCSPCSAQYIKNLNADEVGQNDTDAIQRIKKNHYVDDYVASFETIDQAIRVTKSVIKIHRAGGFELRNFLSNSTQIINEISENQDQIKQTSIQLDKDTTQDKVLGMFWDTVDDTFRFRLNFVRIDPTVLSRQRKPTKREFLSITMSVFDPFGALANCMVYAKHQLQELWKCGMEWDDQISQENYEKWTMWMNELKRCEQTKIPRCYSVHFMSSPNVQMHVFADASEVAFAAVAYWRIQLPTDDYEIVFIAGKTRCAPQKMLSIPRLELQAAVLATRLADNIKSNHKRDVHSTTFWTDSQTVIQWVKSDHRRFKPFVAHRIAEILETTEPSSWRWIPTMMNVADDATRTKYPPVFEPNGRWLTGPQFLKTNSNWPDPTITTTVNEPQEEIRSHRLQVVHASNTLIDFSRFSNLSRMRRTVAWMKRFINNCSNPQNKIHGELNVTEIAAAELQLCIVAQREGFLDEYVHLKNNRQVQSSSTIFQLSPFLDADGVIRMSGRTDAAIHLPTTARRPILLPKTHPLTELVVRFYHQKMKHQLQDAVICEIRKKFWLPHIRTLVRKEAGKCMVCRIRKSSARTPLMGQLPIDRLTPFVRPFTYTGMDFFGPLKVSIGRRHEKRWVALFTCMTIRAVHIELAADLSTDACLICIRNFINVRGVPARIRSDNGRNFVGAAKEIKNMVYELDQEAIKKDLTNKGIEWIFNSPGNPEAGGCWERLVQSVKKVLNITLHESAPRVETLRSILMEAANVVNSRPLTYIPVEPNEEPLTPNHFLLGTSNSSQTVPIYDTQLSCLRKQWRIAQQLKAYFWKRWVQEYLPELTRRTKWHTETKPIEVGDLVLICDSNEPRGHWRRGRIQEVFAGPDGRIRNAAVMTNEGILKRPVSKLAVLDVKNSETSSG